jgi:hypothetical protein
VLVQSDITQEQWRLGGSRLGPYGQLGILLTKELLSDCAVARPTSFIFRNFVSFYLNVLIMNSTSNDCSLLENRDVMSSICEGCAAEADRIPKKTPNLVAHCWLQGL